MAMENITYAPMLFEMAESFYNEKYNAPPRCMNVLLKVKSFNTLKGSPFVTTVSFTKIK